MATEGNTTHFKEKGRLQTETIMQSFARFFVFVLQIVYL